MVRHAVEAADNQRASSVRVSVEHTIGMMERQFPLVFSKDNNQILRGTPHKLMVAACILLNVYVCQHGSQSSLRFRCMPPSVEEWLSDDRLPASHDPFQL